MKFPKYPQIFVSPAAPCPVDPCCSVFHVLALTQSELDWFGLKKGFQKLPPPPKLMTFCEIFQDFKCVISIPKLHFFIQPFSYASGKLLCQGISSNFLPSKSLCPCAVSPVSPIGLWPFILGRHFRPHRFCNCPPSVRCRRLSYGMLLINVWSQAIL